MSEPDGILQKLINEQNSPSVQYVLFDKQNIISKFSGGLADISGNKPVNDRTTYNAYSVTKTFTALAILQLAEKGKLQIDEPVNKYLPAFPYPANITVRQLLSHSGGIPNPIPLNWIHLASEHHSFERDEFFAGILNRNKKIKTKPGQKFAYSNLGYVLLGQLIEQVTGTQFEEHIREHIISRLGLKASVLGFEIIDPRFHAIGYQKRAGFMNLALGIFLNKSKFMAKSEGNWKPFRPFYVNGASYGGLIGTPLAFVRYIQALLSPNSILLSDDYKQILFLENRTFNFHRLILFNYFRQLRFP